MCIMLFVKNDTCYWNKSMVIKEDAFPLMFSQMFLFIGVISATKENIVKHIYFIMKRVIISQLRLF